MGQNVPILIKTGQNVVILIHKEAITFYLISSLTSMRRYMYTLVGVQNTLKGSNELKCAQIDQYGPE